MQRKRGGQPADDGHAGGQIRVFDFVFAQVLLDEELRVRLDKQFRGTQLFGLDECQLEGGVFRLVVGTVGHKVPFLRENFAVHGADDIRGCARAGVAAASAVYINFYLHKSIVANCALEQNLPLGRFNFV